MARSIADRLFVLNELTPRRGYRNSPERVLNIISKLAIGEPRETMFGIPEKPAKSFTMKDRSVAIVYSDGYVVEDQSRETLMGSQFE